MWGATRASTGQDVADVVAVDISAGNADTTGKGFGLGEKGTHFLSVSIILTSMLRSLHVLISSLRHRAFAALG